MDRHKKITRPLVPGDEILISIADKKGKNLTQKEQEYINCLLGPIRTPDGRLIVSDCPVVDDVDPELMRPPTLREQIMRVLRQEREDDEGIPPMDEILLDLNEEEPSPILTVAEKLGNATEFVEEEEPLRGDYLETEPAVVELEPVADPADPAPLSKKGAEKPDSTEEPTPSPV